METNQPNQKVWIQKLLLVAAGLFTLGVIFRLFNPTEAPVQELLSQNFDGSSSSVSGLVFVGTQPNIPSRLPIATGELITDPHQAVIDRFTAFYNLTPFEDLPDLFTGPQHSLTIARDNRLYSLKLDDRNSATNIIDINQAIAVSNTFVGEFFQNSTPPTLLPDSTVFYTDVVEFSAVPESEATMVALMYADTLANIPIVVGHESLVVLSTLVNSNYQVVGVDYVPQRITHSPSQTFNTISAYQAMENINQGRGSIVRAYAEESLFPDLSDIVSGTLTNASVEYRFDNQTDTLSPYYRFSGNITNSRGEEISASIITPAIVTDFSR